jgi:hypothetical protein
VSKRHPGALRLPTLALAVFLAVAVTACGSQTASPGDIPLTSWTEQACTALGSYSRGLDEQADRESADEVDGVPRRSFAATVDVMSALVSALRAIPSPSERRAEVDRFIELLDVSTAAAAKAQPRIDAATQRLMKLIATTDPDTLPPPPEGSTSVGGVMSQMASVPALKEAWIEMTAALSSLEDTTNEKEYATLLGELKLGKCEQDSRGQADPSPPLDYLPETSSSR